MEDNKNLSEQEKKILLFVKDNSKVKTKDVVNILDIKNRRAREILKGMVEKNILATKGRGRNTHYVIRKNMIKSKRVSDNIKNM